MPWLSCRIMPAPPEVLGNQCCCWLGEGAFSCLPSVVVVGAQKAGTTALFSMLAQHPWIGITRFKEMHFFNKARPHAVTGQLEVSFGSYVGTLLATPGALTLLARLADRARVVDSLLAIHACRGTLEPRVCSWAAVLPLYVAWHAVLMFTAPWQAGNSCSMSRLKPHQHTCSACKHQK